MTTTTVRGGVSAAPLPTSPLLERIRPGVIGEGAGPRRTRTGRAGSPTPTTPPPAGRSTSSRTSSASRCCPATPTPTPRAPAPACRPRRLREDARRIIHDAVGGTDDARGHLLRVRGHRRRSTSWSASSNCALPAGLDDRYRLLDADPGRRAAGGLRRPVRAPLQRAAVAGVHRRRGRDRRGRRRPHRPRRPGPSELVALRRPAAAHRQLLRRLQRHRHPDRHRRGSPRCCTARRAVVLGLRRRRTVRADPHGRDAQPGRGDDKDAVFLSPAQVRRRPADARGAGRAPRPGPQPGARPCPAAARSPSSTRPSTATSTTRSHREEGGTPAIVESIRAGLVFAAQASRRHRPHPGPRGTTVAAGAVDRWAANPAHRDPRQPATPDRLSIVSFSVRARRAATCTTTSSSRCSTTCSASRPAAAAPAPARTATGCSASTPQHSHALPRRDRPRLRGHQARLGPDQLQLLHLRHRPRLPRSTPST